MRYKDLKESNYLDYSVLKQFSKKKFGWINSEGELIPLDMYQHVEYFRKGEHSFPEVDKLLKQIEDKRDQLEYEFSQTDEPYGWHSSEYYLTKDEQDAERKIVSIIYNNGWGRLGIFKKKGIDYIELECLTKFKDRLLEFIREIAKMLNLEVTINLVDELEYKGPTKKPSYSKSRDVSPYAFSDYVLKFGSGIIDKTEFKNLQKYLKKNKIKHKTTPGYGITYVNLFDKKLFDKIKDIDWYRYKFK